MDLLELFVAFTTGASLIEIRKHIFVVASVANGQGAIFIGASVEHGTIAYSAFGGFRTCGSMTQLACEPCMGMRIGTIRMSGNNR